MRRLSLFLALSGFLAILANAQQPLYQEADKIPMEIVSLRTEYSETFDNHDGTCTTKIYSGKKYYRDRGEYKQIDLSVKQEIKEGFTRAINAGPYAYRYDPADKSKGYKFTRGLYYVTYSPAGDRTGKTSIVTPTTEGIKEKIIFTSDASPTVSWKISTNAAVSFYGGVLTFTDSNYNFLFRIPAAYAFDSAERNIPVTASFTGDMLSYTLSVPEDTVWPITLDPSTEITAQQDGRVHFYDNDTYQNVRDHFNNGTVNYTVLSAGQWYDSATPNYFVFRGFASFPIPGVYSVEACTLYVNGKTDSSTDDYEIYIIGASEYASVLEADDYQRFDGQQSGSAHTGTVLNNTWNTSSYSSDWNSIVFNSSGRDSVVAATDDTLWIAMMSKNDYDNTAPTGEEYVYFESSNHATDKPYLSITYIPSKKPYNFTMTALDSTTIACSWNHEGNNEDKFYIINQADSSIVDSTTVNAIADTVSGLDWNTQYVWAAAADSSGTQWISEPDSTYSLTGPPSDVSFFDYRSSHFSMLFDNGQNPDSTKFAVKIVINSDSLYWNDSLNDTTSTEYIKTEAAWGDTIAIGYRGFLNADTIHSIGIHGKNADGLWSENWYSVKTSEEPSLITINLTGTPNILEELITISGVTDYGTSRSVASNDSIASDTISPELGQLYNNPDYFVKRFGVEVVLPDGYEAHAGSLFVYVTADSTDTDFNVLAYEGDWNSDSYHDEAFWNFDGRQTGTTAHNGTQLLELFNTSSISTDNWHYWVYNNDGLNVIASALGDTLRNTIISSRDSSGTAPTGNEYFTIDADSSYITFIVDLPDTLPGNFSATPISPDSILAEWIDRNHSEEKYIVVDFADSSTVSDTLDANIENAKIGGLSANTQYKFMLKVIGGNLDGQYSAPDSAYTHANVPGKPSLYFAGGDVWDESGKSNHGTNNGAIFERDGRASNNHAYSFNGTNSYINCSDTTDFDFIDDFTLACWIKRTGADTSYNRVITYENASNEASYRLLFNDNNQLYFQVHNGNTVSTGYSPVLTENAWYHITGNYDGNLLRIYVNGDSTNVSSSTSGDISLYEDRIFSVGRSPGGGSTYLDAILDDIRVYNRALTTDQVDSLYNYNTFDDFVYGPELVTNGGMELDSDWIACWSGTQVRSDEQAHSGTYSRKWTANASGASGGTRQVITGLTIGKTYKIIAWFRGLDLVSGNFRLGLGGTTIIAPVSNGTWIKGEVTYQATAESATLYLVVHPAYEANANKSCYFDDVSIKEIDYTQSSLKLHYSFDIPDSLMIFTLDTNNNPSYTQFAVQDSVTGWYIDTTAEPESLRAPPLGEWGWKTYALWGAALGDTLSGITPGNLYVLRAKARSGE